MPEALRIALAQPSASRPGDPAGNLAALRAARAAAARLGADLVATPALSLSGTPLLDLARRRDLLDACDDALLALARDTADGGPGMLVGLPVLDGGHPREAVALLDRGAVGGRRTRHAACCHDVFVPGPVPGPVAFRGTPLGLLIGADAGLPDVAETLAESGAALLVWHAASPCAEARSGIRLQRALGRVVETGLACLACNPVGGADELVYDGGSFALNHDRRLAALLPAFEPGLAATRWREEGGRLACEPGTLAPDLDRTDWLYRALWRGLADYARGAGESVALDLADGAGAALVGALAVDALGPRRVRGLVRGEAEAVSLATSRARRLGIALAPMEGRPAAALRRGEVLLSAADRHATALGRFDRDCDYAPLRDVDPAEVAALLAWRAAARPPGALGPPAAVEGAERPGAAEGAHHAVLRALLAEDPPVDALVGTGYQRALVARVRAALDRAERLRRQAPPGPMIGARFPGDRRRYPLGGGMAAAPAVPERPHE